MTHPHPRNNYYASRTPYPVEQCIIDILKKNLGLDDEHIWLGLISRPFPTDTKDLYITVEIPFPRGNIWPMENQLCMTNNKKKDHKKEFYCRSIIQIDLISRSKISMGMRKRVIDALKSSYALQLQQEYLFRILDIPDSFLDLKGLMGPDFNRFNIRLSVMTSMNITEPEISDIYNRFMDNKKLLIPDKYFRNLDELVQYVERKKIHLFLYSYVDHFFIGECSLRHDFPSNTFYETVVEILLKMTEYTWILTIYSNDAPDKKIGTWAILAHKNYLDTYSIQRLKSVKRHFRYPLTGK